ncbi:CCA tRNA nucleotidyltransferase [Candidatus Peregrinibacteria bacterium]|jgi:putative nucleotidyltransferase with HDIG domain|nr:CCA tRNA nucleotidyltransferase [Candidatus Peregrinibacteria bacterium]MBT7736320.1 CCA tRNA nucleotidyltransferase [Candidatus Peregrinibacteria bacterium]
MKATSIEIIEILKKAGHEAYWAGGCVRDMLLGIEPKDFDIVTSAKPDEIEELLEHTIPIGKQFGVILAIQNGHNFEIATFRSDSGYSDGRRPDAIEFTNAEEDAKRRDFTINAIFYDPIEDKIMDYVDGQKDMKDELIRFIGEPEERIKEDHLRILRAIRFKNEYDMQYHPDTYQAVKKHVKLIEDISKERVKDELNKMIMSKKNSGQAFEELFEVEALELIIPELCKLKGLAQPKMYHQEGDVWDHSLRALNSLTEEEGDPNPLPENPPTIALKWATLMHDIGKYDTFQADEDRIRYDHHSEVGAEMSSKILKRLKFDKKTIDRVKWLIEHHMMVVPLFEMPDARRRHWFLQPGFEELLEVYRADSMGIIPMDLSMYEKLKKLYRHEIAKLKLMPKQLISGKEIMSILGIEQGEKVGDILKEVRDKQLSHEIKTRKEAKKYVIAKMAT